ncbi:MAG: NifU family protein [Patescibacteria group bacterium]
MREAVEKALLGVSEALKIHAGGIELVDCDEASGVVKVRFTGMCSSCMLQAVTLQDGVAVMLHETVPQIKEVVQVA